MKKFLVTALLVVTAFGLTACGGSEAPTSEATEATSSAIVDVQDGSAEATTTADDVKLEEADAETTTAEA